MPDDSNTVSVRVLDGVADVPVEEWDACAGGNDPFVSHAFLHILEESGCVGDETGWLPRHLAITGDDGTLVACAPLYVKGHSYGEYVFDWGWGEAYERAGGRYYPKLQAAVPFTPVTGRRLLIRPGAPAKLADSFAAGMVELARRMGVSSLHVTFPTEAEWRRLGEMGFLLRIGQQFHWFNQDYGSFDGFLDALSSRKRKAIRKERRGVAEHGIVIRPLTGSDIEERHWDAFFGFYTNTSDRKWGFPYLNRAFFSLLGERLADRVVLVMAETADGRPAAGALNLLGADALYGRYWGCAEAYRFLHFEACYYQAIDFAIANRLTRVEAGAQGPHKIQRGYLPQATYSAHWIADSGFRRAVDNFLQAERPAILEEIRRLIAESPYRSEGAREA